MTVAALCERARAELACLGDLGAPLLQMVGVVESVAGDRDADVLDDPSLALEVLLAAGDADPAVVGRMLDYLRARAGTAPAGRLPVAGASGGRHLVRVADAVATYEAGALALLAKGTQHTYRTWTRRLVAAHADDLPGDITAGDLKDLIAGHVLQGRGEDERRRSGRSAEENAVTAFRHLWSYFEEKGWVTDNVAMRLRKPSRSEPRRRPVRPDEAALLRHLARATGQDPLLDEVTLAIPERLGLRRIELCRLRMCDVDLDRGLMAVWGKNDKPRSMPIPPGLSALLRRYIADRRPAHIPAAAWHQSHEVLLRRPPAGRYPLGRPAGRRRIEDRFERLRQAAPAVFEGEDLSLHSYRHAIGTFVDHRYSRAVTRAVLGHTSRRSPTDFYVHVPIEQVAEAIAAYEDHLVEVGEGTALGAA